MGKPHTIEQPFARLMERLGVTQEQVDAVARSEGEEYMKHAEFERQTRADGGMRYEYPTSCLGMLRIEDQSGVLWPLVCDACGFEVGVQVQRIDPERLLEHQLAKAGIPEMFAGKAFVDDEPAQEPVKRACREWIRGFKREPLPAVALWGKVGVGKSHLLALIIETLVRNYGVDAMYRSGSELFRRLQAGLDDASFDQQWQRILRVPVLAIDDIGAGRASEWRADLFASLVDFRYSKELPLLIATNVPPPGWEKAFGDRTNSRMRGMMIPLHLEGPDRRAQGVQQTLAGASA